MQNFRHHILKSGWLTKKSSERHHLMTEVEYKEYIRTKNEKIARAEDEEE